MNGRPPETTLLSLAQTMPKRPDRRDDGREHSLLRIGCLLFDDRRELCLIRNISAGGALVRTYSQMAPGRPVALELKQGESVSGVIRWADGNMIGVMFSQLVDVIQLLADSSEWPRPRQPRVEIAGAVWIEQGGSRYIAESLDLSQGGVKIRSRSTINCRDEVRVELRGMPALSATCRWSFADTHGLQFREPLPLKSLVRWVREQQAAAGMLKRAQGAAA